MLAFIKRFRNLPREHSIHCAHQDEHNRVEESYHVGRVHVGVADQHIVFSSGVVEHGAGGGYDHPHYYY